MTLLNDPQEPVKIRCDEDLLALIPHQLGYQPRNCAVLFIPVASGGALCLKLPTPSGSEDLVEYAQQLSEVTATTGHVEQATVVVYSDTAAVPQPEADFFRAAWLGLAVEDSGLRTTGGFVVGPQHWWNLQRFDEPQPLSDIKDSQLNAHMVTLGSCFDQLTPEQPGRVPDALKHRSSEFLDALGRLTESPGEGPIEDEVPGDHRAATGVSQHERVDDHGRYGFRAPACYERDLAHWREAIAALNSESGDWTTALARLSDQHLARLVTSLTHSITRDAIFYSWLTGDQDRAIRAHRGLQASLREVLSLPAPAPEHRAAAEDVAEGLCCAHAVLGQWESIPDWATVEAAYRILEGLDLLLTHGLESAGAPRESERRCAMVHADVVSARAQLEVYRGRAFTAMGLLDRSNAIAADREAARTVRRRLDIQDIPWWSTDPRTAWPGDRWWAKRQDARHAHEK
ncbi:hypothetical protein IEE91_10195 [Kocuria sp. cx-455]|uniref:hypothetical protein n=1 Tax=Kocuria sp. cx-455 TaxID=2771377 RepID=UPI0016889C7B|nr:hypothetical protein [Kocuria sp. cx-455]MBD2765552.1 hypothetical protein [Kocuria sp. cx-455]